MARVQLIKPSGAVFQFTSLYAALTSSASGDIVQAGPGTYSVATTGETFPLSVPANVSLVSLQGAAQTIISGVVASGSDVILGLAGAGCTVSGFTIQNSTSNGIAINAPGRNDCAVMNCVIGTCTTGVILGRRMRIQNILFTGTMNQAFGDDGTSYTAEVWGTQVSQTAPRFTNAFVNVSAAGQLDIHEAFVTTSATDTAVVAVDGTSVVRVYDSTLGNQASGVWIRAAGASAEFHDCRFVSCTTDITVAAAGSLRMFNTPYATSSGLSTLATFSVNGVPNPGTAGQFLGLAGTPPVPTWTSSTTAVTDVLTVGQGGTVQYTDIEVAEAAATSGDILWVYPGTFQWPHDTALDTTVNMHGFGYPVLGSENAGTAVMVLSGEQYVNGMSINMSSPTLMGTGILMGNASTNNVIRDVKIAGHATGNLIEIGGTGTPTAAIYNFTEISGGVSNRGLIQTSGATYIHGWYIRNGGSDDDYYLGTTGGSSAMWFDLNLAGGGFGSNAVVKNDASTQRIYGSDLGTAGYGANIWMIGTSPTTQIFGSRISSTGGGVVDVNVATATGTLEMFGCRVDQDKIVATNGAIIKLNDRPVRVFCTTTDGTATDLSYGGAGAAYIVIPSSTLCSYTWQVTAKRTDAVGECMAWTVTALALNNAGTSTLIDAVVTETANSGTLTWTLGVSVTDSTVDTIRLTFTGEAAKTIKTVADCIGYTQV